MLKEKLSKINTEKLEYKKNVNIFMMVILLHIVVLCCVVLCTTGKLAVYTTFNKNHNEVTTRTSTIST